ncbi:MAG: aminoglycoside phosphotransferase family protein [Cyanobacteriota bacterium]|nr:aminoglycoside phosphotransferase family protein [Cyanobacteriota bacterium]
MADVPPASGLTPAPHLDPRLAQIAGAFAGSQAVEAVNPLGHGNINTTYLVEGAGLEPFVLQRLNTTVFAKPQLVMGNLLAISAHVEGRLQREELAMGGARWVLPRVLRSAGGEPWLVEGEAFWRAISFVPATTSLDALETAEQAREVGYGLGMFHELLHDLPCEQLADTLEGFHITPGYLSHYHAVCAAGGDGDGDRDVVAAAARERRRQGRDPEREAWAHHFVAQREGWAGVLEEAKARGELPLRPIHGDPKVNNVLLDASSGRAVALVDLDTVKPGLVHYDIGDCLRSGCNPLGEETTAFDQVRFDLALCAALLEGYGAVAHRFLSPADHRYLYDAIRLLSFELGVRFFTDHLAGDVYFHSQRPGHNLDRALVQFHLAASIEAQKKEIRGLLARMGEKR